MKKEIGLWVDHREAIIVILTKNGEEIHHITSNVGKKLRYSGSSHKTTPDGLKEVTAENQRDRKYTNSLNVYYDKLSTIVSDADCVQIFGPGEAKGELEKRLALAGFSAHISAVQTADKMTDRQIAAKVRDHFAISN
jgi:hypothetical protein